MLRRDRGLPARSNGDPGQRLNRRFQPLAGAASAESAALLHYKEDDDSHGFRGRNQVWDNGQENWFQGSRSWGNSPSSPDEMDGPGYVPLFLLVDTAR
jgi:hypothetical protein